MTVLIQQSLFNFYNQNNEFIDFYFGKYLNYFCVWFSLKKTRKYVIGGFEFYVNVCIGLYLRLFSTKLFNFIFSNLIIQFS